jgi:hypothetical protein
VGNSDCSGIAARTNQRAVCSYDRPIILALEITYLRLQSRNESFSRINRMLKGPQPTPKLVSPTPIRRLTSRTGFFKKSMIEVLSNPSVHEFGQLHFFSRCGQQTVWLRTKERYLPFFGG